MEIISLFVALRSHPLRGEKKGDGDLSCMNGDMEVRKSCRSRKNRFESVNQSLLFDQLVNRYECLCNKQFHLII